MGFTEAGLTVGRETCVLSIRADEHLKETLNRLNAISEAIDDGKLDFAEHHARQALLFAEEHGIVSAHLSWVLAVVFDNKAAETGDPKDFEEALDWIRRAVQTDELAVPFWRSYHIIVDRIRTTIMDPERDASDKAKEPLYRALLNADEATPEVHLAYGRHLLACGRAIEAVKLLESLTKLHPANREAWAALAEAATAVGDIALAVDASTEAALERSPVRTLRLVPVAEA